MNDLERLIPGRAEVPAPSPAFEARLLAAMEAKQRALGRVPTPGELPGPRSPGVPARPWRPLPFFARLAAVTVVGALAGIGAGWLREARGPREAPLAPSAAPSVAKNEEPAPPPVVVTESPPREIVAPPAPRDGVAPQESRPSALPVRGAGEPSAAVLDSATLTRRIVEAKEPTSYALEDGSRLVLDAGARVALSGRSVHVERGRGFVEVAKGAQGFEVTSERARAVAHGTKFAFDLGEKGLAVAVSQGTVELANDHGSASVRLGEEGTAAFDAPPVVASAPRLSSLCEWMRGVYGALKKGPCATGELVAIAPQGQEIRLAVRDVHVTVHLEDGIARTTIDTTYFNEAYERLEGTFSFLVPPGASVSRLAMYVNGELMEGGVLERTEARRVYEQIRYAPVKRDPALLEWMEGNVYKMRIFPLEPRQEKRVIVSFTQELEPLYGKLRYALPLEGRGSAVYGHMAIDVRVKNAVEAPESSLELTATRDGRDLLLHREESSVKPERDLILYLDGASTPRAATLATSEGRYVLARWKPKLARTVRKHDPRHFAILVDESGARTAAEVIAQNEIVARLLSELDDEDRFELLAVTTRVRRLKEGFLPPRENPMNALAFLDGIQPLGASNLELGLAEAARSLEGKSNPHVVYVGSGIASFGERDPARLVERLAPGTVFVGVGVGKKTDESLLASLASRTAGTYVLIHPEEPIAWRVFDLVAALATPRLSALSAVALDARGGIVPGDLLLSRGTVADGEEVRVLARFPNDARPAKIQVSGFQGDELVGQGISLDGAREDALYLPSLWGRRRVETLVRDGAAEHRDEIVALGKRFFIATPFTSLIVLENAAMYQELHVEPSPRDAWAFYETPQTIPVVSDWGPFRVRLGDEDEALQQIELGTSYEYPVTTTVASTAGTNIWNVGAIRVYDQDMTLAAREKPALHPKARAGYGGDFSYPGSFGVNDSIGAAAKKDMGATFTQSQGYLTRGRGINAPDINGNVLEYGLRGRRWDAFLDSPDVFYQANTLTAAFSQTSFAAHPLPSRLGPIEDLTLLAPGLEMEPDDVRSFVERTLHRKPAPGKQDPAALALLEKARQAFQTRSILFGDYEGTATATGELNLRHRLSSRLEEIVVADTTDLYELYPELGLAAHRVRTRFEDQALEQRFPFLVPTVAALEGWDVLSAGENQIALVLAARRIELDFDAQGALVERREYEAGTLIRRTVIASVLRSKPAATASFERPAESYVVLDVPARTLSALDAELARVGPDMKRHVEDQCRYSQLLTRSLDGQITDGRLGNLVLHLAAGNAVTPDFVQSAKPYPAFAAYARAILDERRDVERLRDFIPTHGSDFFQGMARFALAMALLERQGIDADARAEAPGAIRAYVSAAPAPELVVALARAARSHGVLTTKEVLALYDSVPEDSAVGLLAREEAAALVFDTGGVKEATRRFESAYRLALARGFFPQLDSRFTSLGYSAVEHFVDDAFRWAYGNPQRLLAVAFAFSDGRETSRALLALPEPLPRGDWPVLGALLATLPQGDASSDKTVSLLLARDSLKNVPALHDVAAFTALRQGHYAEGGCELEIVLGLEATEGVADPVPLRQRVTLLLEVLGHTAAKRFGLAGPSPELVGRVLATLDRVRRVDPEDPDAYAWATRVLFDCGEKELALEAATTPVALHPMDGAAIQQAGGLFAYAGQHALAANLYRDAARAEPQDPTPLLLEAREHEALGERAKARALRQKIVQGKWHERFQSIVTQAAAELTPE
jgi:Ca-activated chloride channel family protein